MVYCPGHHELYHSDGEYQTTHEIMSTVPLGAWRRLYGVQTNVRWPKFPEEKMEKPKAHCGAGLDMSVTIPFTNPVLRNTREPPMYPTARHS